jgi:hypothetical protein
MSLFRRMIHGNESIGPKPFRRPPPHAGSRED